MSELARFQKYLSIFVTTIAGCTVLHWGINWLFLQANTVILLGYLAIALLLLIAAVAGAEIIKLLLVDDRPQFVEDGEDDSISE